MACINGSVSLQGVGLTASAHAALSLAGGRVSRSGNGLQASVSLVCIAETAYLTVQPEFIWLTESNNFVADVEVISNTYWTTE